MHSNKHDLCLYILKHSSNTACGHHLPLSVVVFNPPVIFGSLTELQSKIRHYVSQRTSCVKRCLIACARLVMCKPMISKIAKDVAPTQSQWQHCIALQICPPLLDAILCWMGCWSNLSTVCEVQHYCFTFYRMKMKLVAACRRKQFQSRNAKQPQAPRVDVRTVESLQNACPPYTIEALSSKALDDGNDLDSKPVRAVAYAVSSKACPSKLGGNIPSHLASMDSERRAIFHYLHHTNCQLSI